MSDVSIRDYGHDSSKKTLPDKKNSTHSEIGLSKTLEDKTETSWLVGAGKSSDTSDGSWERRKNPDASVLQDAGHGAHSKVSVGACVDGVEGVQLRGLEGRKSCATSWLGRYRSQHVQGLCSDGIVSPSPSVTMCSNGWSVPKERPVCTP